MLEEMSHQFNRVMDKDLDGHVWFYCKCKEKFYSFTDLQKHIKEIKKTKTRNKNVRKHK